MRSGEPIVGADQTPQGSFAQWGQMTLQVLFAPLIILIDFLTKQHAVSHLTLHDPIIISPFLNFTLIYNTGAAFGFLNGAKVTWVLAGVSLIASVCFYFWYRSAKHVLQRFAIVLLISGALGNFIDRAFYGFVIDFFDFHIGQYHWPAFNIADAAISVGVFLLLIYWVKYEWHH